MKIISFKNCRRQERIISFKNCRRQFLNEIILSVPPPQAGFQHGRKTRIAYDGEKKKGAF